MESLKLPGVKTPLTALSVTLKNDSSPWGYSARMFIYGKGCSELYDQLFPDEMEVRFRTVLLGEVPILVVTGVHPGVSESGYEHLLLTYQNGLHPLAPMLLENGDTGGFFVGNLGGDRGPGLALWSAIWKNGESHYGPHRFDIIIYRWRGGRFSGPEHFVTKRKFKPDPDSVVQRLGFDFRDLTGRGRFSVTNAIMRDRLTPPNE